MSLNSTVLAFMNIWKTNHFHEEKSGNQSYLLTGSRLVYIYMLDYTLWFRFTCIWEVSLLILLSLQSPWIISCIYTSLIVFSVYIGTDQTFHQQSAKGNCSINIYSNGKPYIPSDPSGELFFSKSSYKPTWYTGNIIEGFSC